MEFELGEYIRLYNIEKGESLIPPSRMLYRIYNRYAKLVFTFYVSVKRHLILNLRGIS